MAAIALLGDSVIDNGAYVGPGEPDMPAQLAERLPGWEVLARAVDGARAADALADLRARPLPPGLPVFLSAGGNDALQHLGLLTDPAPMPLAAAMVRLGEIRAAFRADFAALLDALAGHRALVATIYDPAFAAHGDGPEAMLQAPAEAALAAYNDAIQAEALARGLEVLELRRIFTAPQHYADPIEPSAAGGARLAEAVAAWARR